MKKLFALMLALVMMLTATFALADTVTIGFKVDTEILSGALTSYGMPEEQVSQMAPLFDLLNKLGLKVTTAGNAAQLDLSIGETTALSIGGKAETDILIGTNLLPSYLFKITEEDMKALLSQIPGFGGEGGFNPEAFQALGEKISGYVMKVLPTFQTALQPGEIESGSWEFEGYTFDVKQPIIVDTKAIGEAVKTLVNDLMSDEEIASLLGSFGGSIDPQEIIANINEAMSEEHMPDVTVEVYQSTANPAISYAKSEATYKGADAPSYTFWMLGKEDGSMYMELFVADGNVTIALTYNPQGSILLELKGDEAQGQYAALAFTMTSATGGQLDICLFSRQPMLSILFNVEMGDGEITLDLNEEGKTVLGLADLQGEKAEEYTQGLQQELLTNAMPLMAIPELAQVLALFTQGMN